jgi:glycosyltransferase involved in cell wall biosynthesis
VKIFLIGHYKNNPDEGVKNIAFSLYYELSRENETQRCDIRDFFRSLSTIRKFRPDIIHFIVGPSSIVSFLLVKIASLLFPKSTVVMSAPQYSRFRFEQMIPYLKPDRIFVQSYESENKLKRYGCKTRFAPGGVDSRKFLPLSKGEKLELRKKYGFDESEFIFLHVGHIKRGRNLTMLANFCASGKVLIIGSSSTPVDIHVYNELKEKGIEVIIGYKPKIEEIYGISDCYVFPTMNSSNCIETPLSVLEAMSCDLPVITTRFGALPRMFDSDCPGLYFIDDEKQITELVKKIRSNQTVIKTRENVLIYSWQNIASILKNEYLALPKNIGNKNAED